MSGADHPAAPERFFVVGQIILVGIVEAGAPDPAAMTGDRDPAWRDCGLFARLAAAVRIVWPSVSALSAPAIPRS